MNRTLVLAGFIIVCGAAVGGYFLASDPTSSLNSALGNITPTEIRVDRPFISGEVATVEIPLLKSGGTDWLIEDYKTSCGCMGISNEDGEIQAPFNVSRGRNEYVTVSIDTKGKRGTSAFFVRFAGNRSGKSIVQEFKVLMDVEPAWTVEPSVLHFENAEPGEIIERTLAVYDGVESRSLQLEKIRTSDDARITVVREAASGSPLQVSLGNETRSMARRYTLRVFYTVPDKLVSNDFIALVGLNSQVKYDIPIICRFQEPDFRLIPEELVFSQSGGNSATDRIVWMQAVANKPAPFIPKPPAGVSIEMSRFGDVKLSNDKEDDPKQMYKMNIKLDNDIDAVFAERTRISVEVVFNGETKTLWLRRIE